MSHQLLNAIQHAVHFLESSQWPGGFWVDFNLYVGMSNQWVTAYTAHCLGRAAPGSPALPAARAYLLGKELPAGGWGFNRHTPPDCDSTANVVYFLARYARQTIEPAMLRRCAGLLLDYQAADGGFITYLNRPAPTGADKHAFLYAGSGWTCSHLSVTGLTAAALLAVDPQAYCQRLQRATKFICRCQSADGYWEDHWWQDRIYGTYWAARQLAQAGEREGMQRAVSWMARAGESDGSWGNGKGSPGVAFYTALALSTLLLDWCEATGRVGSIVIDPEPTPKNAPEESQPEYDYTQFINRGLEWLLRSQLPDGSWLSVPMLLTPAPEVLVSWQSDHPSSHLATGDQNRIFTTATVLAALARCRDWRGWESA